MPRLHRLLPVLLATALLALGCTEEPAAPTWDNPLDPQGPGGGDAFQVQAIYSGGQVVVTWNEPQGPAVFSYQILHALTSDGPFTVLGTVDAGASSFIHEEFSPNDTNYYKVRGLDRNDEPSALSNVTAAAVQVPPVVTLGATPLASRWVELTIAAAVGDTVEVDSLPDFPAPARAPLVDGTATLTWDVGLAADPEETKVIYARVRTGGVPGAAVHDSLDLDFTPDVTFVGNPAALARRDAPLRIMPSTGVTRMRFAAERAALDAAPWETPADTFTGYLLGAAADSQLVFAEFEGDLGLGWVDSVWAVPDRLQDLELILNGGSETVTGPGIPVAVEAAATQIRLAGSSADLAATPWQEYAAPVVFTHDACASGVEKTVWAQVRNDWITADALHDTVTWLPGEALGLTYTGPDTLAPATAVTLSGTAVAGTCTGPVDGVFLDPGAGETAATGLAVWTFPWTSPAAAETTTVSVAWRVTAGPETATGSFDVVIAP